MNAGCQNEEQRRFVKNQRVIALIGGHEAEVQIGGPFKATQGYYRAQDSATLEWHSVMPADILRVA